MLIGPRPIIMQIIKKWLLVDINWTGTDYLVSNQGAASKNANDKPGAFYWQCLKMNQDPRVAGI